MNIEATRKIRSKICGESILRQKVHYEKFVRCKNNPRSLTRTLRKDFEKTLANKIKNNPKLFWS